MSGIDPNRRHTVDTGAVMLCYSLKKEDISTARQAPGRVVSELVRVNANSGALSRNALDLYWVLTLIGRCGV